MCRSMNGLRLFYDKHQRLRAINIQAPSLRYGLVADQYGPTEGRHVVAEPPPDSAAGSS